MKLLYFPVFSVIFLHNTCVLVSSLTLRGNDKHDDAKSPGNLNIEKGKKLRKQFYTHTNSKVSGPVSSSRFEDELASATTVYHKYSSSEPPEDVEDEILFRLIKKTLEADSVSTSSSGGKPRTVNDDDIRTVVHQFRVGKTSALSVTLQPLAIPCELNVAISAIALVVSVIGLKGDLNDWIRKIFDDMPDKSKIIQLLNKIGGIAIDATGEIAKGIVNLTLEFLKFVTWNSLKDFFSHLWWYDIACLLASMAATILSGGASLLIQVVLIIADSVFLIKSIIDCINKRKDPGPEPIEMKCPPPGCQYCTSSDQASSSRSEPWYIDEKCECCRGDPMERGICNKVCSGINECDITLEEVNMSIVEKGFEHGKNALIHILDIDIPVSGILTSFDIDTYAHDQNRWGRCSILNLEYRNAADEIVNIIRSPVVPRSASYQPFSWSSETNQAVERGGVLKLKGFTCWGGGIHTKNTNAKVVVTKSACTPSFHYKALKSTSNNKCVYYDHWGDLYEGDCTRKSNKIFSFDTKKKEIVAEAGPKANQCLRADRIWPKLNPCNGADDQEIDFLDGMIKNSASNKCLQLFPPPTTPSNRMTFGDCEKAAQFTLITMYPPLP